MSQTERLMIMCCLKEVSLIEKVKSLVPDPMQFHHSVSQQVMSVLYAYQDGSLEGQILDAFEDERVKKGLTKLFLEEVAEPEGTLLDCLKVIKKRG